MKKYLLVFAAAFAVSGLRAQEMSGADALIYAQDNLTGTARFRAMSGAFGALGGDLSAINVNPAGSAIFANSQVGFTLTSYNPKNKANYFGTNTSENYSSFDVNQFGGAFVFKNHNPDSKWKKFAVSANYENANNLDNDFYIAGTNPTNSVDSYFLGYANSAGLSAADYEFGGFFEDQYVNIGNFGGFGAQQALIGYQGFVINPTGGNPDATTFESNVPAGGNYYHDFLMETRGYNGKIAINFAAQYGDNWYFGANVNGHFSDYLKWTSFYESNGNDTANGLQWFEFNNQLRTYGSGVSLQLGTIVKVTPSFRAGVSYDTPTWLWLNDELVQTFSFNDATGGTGGFRSPINIYETYKLRVPGKWTGSLAYVFGTRGLLSVDYSVKDYANSHYGATGSNDSFYDVINDEIEANMDMASTLRIGGEIRASNWSFRGGYRYEQSPYKDDTVMGDLTGFSGGLGYNWGRTRLDLAYNYWERDYQQQFFVTGLTDPANLKTQSHNVSASLTFEFR
ncbi:MAG: transporter [Flavobacterium sp.]|uniref:OmpP1/FadL family transporter n=1 Tax=Flavobacterium sp. TaxID=239 RepID=UPI0012101020|nr:transporter [Flavobacterium sp.]RZJ65344.1 MAG: transporter [Flavobacterium sp.]